MVPASELIEVDRFALALYGRVARRMLDAYDAFDFQTVFHAANEFVTVHLSAFYADLSKDRLYTFRAGSTDRRSAQTALYVIADGLTRLLAPVLSVTADEVWQHLPGTRDASVHLVDFPSDVDGWMNADLEQRWNALLELRGQVNAALELARAEKTIGASLTAHVTLTASGDSYTLLKQYEQDLPMILIVSSAAVEQGAAGAPIQFAVTRAIGDKCPRCWRVVTETLADGDQAGLCTRCEDAVGDEGVVVASAG